MKSIDTRATNLKSKRSIRFAIICSCLLLGLLSASCSSSVKTFANDSEPDWNQLIKSGDIENIEKAVEGGLSASNMANFPGADGATAQKATPVWLACYYDKPDILRYLLKNKADVNSKASHIGDSALILASKLDRQECIRLLLANGADVNQSNDGGMTSLHVSVMNRTLPVIELLLQSHADPNVTNIDNTTPLGVLVATNSTSVEEDVSIAELLVKNGANVTHTLKDGINVFKMAYGLKKEDLAIYFLKAHSEFLSEEDLPSLKDYLKKNKMSRLLDLLERQRHS